MKINKNRDLIDKLKFNFECLYNKLISLKIEKFKLISEQK